MKIAINETPEISTEEVMSFVELWQETEEIKKKYESLRNALISKFKKGAVSPALESGVTLAFKSYMSKSTSYQKILTAVKETLAQDAQEGNERAQQLLGMIEGWYMEQTKESERNTITPKVEKVVTTTKAVRMTRGN